MSYYARKAVASAFLNLKRQKDALVRSIYPHTSVLGLVGIPAGLVLLLFATLLWLLAFTLVPMLLLFAWMALQPWRLWQYFKSLITGKNFSG